MATYKIPDDGTINSIPSTATEISFQTGNETSYGALNLTSKGNSSTITLSTYGDATQYAKLGTLTTGPKDITVASGAKFNIVGGSVSNSAYARLFVYGELKMDNWYRNDKTGSGASLHPSYLSVEDGGTVNVTGGTVLNRGGCTIVIKDGGLLTTENRVVNWASIDLYGSFVVKGPTTNTNYAFDNAPSNDYAVFTVYSGGMLSASSLKNYETQGSTNWAGTIDVREGGTITVDGKAINNSVRTAKQNDATKFYGGITVNGSFTAKGENVTDGIAFNNSGTLIVNSTGTLCAGGYLNSDNGFVATGGKSFKNSSGTVEIYGAMYADGVTNNKSLTVSGVVSSPVTFSAASLNSSAETSVASFTNAEVSIRGNLSNNNASAKATFTSSTVQVGGNVSNVGKAANNGGMTIQDSVFVAGGSFSNSGTINITDTEVTIGENNNTTLILENKSGGSIDFSSSEANALTVNGAMKNTGALTVSGTGSSPVTFSAVSLNNNETASFASFTDVEVSFSGTVSNSGKTASGGGLTIQDSVFEAGGAVTNSGTLTVGATAANKSVSFQSGAVTNSGTLTVEKASGTSATFTATSLNNSATNSVASFTDTEISISGNVSNSGKTANGGGMTIQDSVFEADGSLTNSGTLTVGATAANKSVSFQSGAVTNSGTLTVEKASGTSATFTAASLNNSATNSVASFTGTEISISGNVSNSGKTANGGGMTIQDSVFVAGGSFSNSGTMNFTDTEVTIGENSNATLILENKSGATIDINSTGANHAFTVNGDMKNVGTITVSSSESKQTTLTANGTVTNSNTSSNRAVITVDAGSSFSANSFVNNNGRFEFVYKQNGTNISIDSFNNQGGFIQIDVTEYLDNRVESPIAVVSGITLSAPDKLGTITFVDTKGRTDELEKIFCTLNASNEIVLGPQPIFVNAKWTSSSQIPTQPVTYGDTHTLTYGVNAFGNVQDAINAATPGTTIVFYDINPGPLNTDVKDFKFYTQGLVTVDKNLFFESNTLVKAVKFDALKIVSGCTAEFRSGLYSLEDFLDNDGTLKVVNHTRFNGDLIKNANGIITIDKTSRLVAASIDAGIVEVRSGFVNNNIRWIEQPYTAKIGDNVTINLVYPKTSSSPVEQDGVVHEKRIIENKEYNVVVETINPGDQVYAKTVNGQYICYGTAAHHKDGEGNPQTPGDGWESFYAATEYGGLQLVDDEFDLNRTGDSGPYSTAVIYVNNSSIGFTGTCETAGTLTISGTGLEDGTYTYFLPKSNGYNSNTVTVSNGAFTITDSTSVLKAGKSYSVVLTQDGTFQAKGQNLTGDANPVSITAANGSDLVVYGSFLSAMNSAYIKGHTIGTAESGMVIRLQAGTYVEGDFTKNANNEPTGSLGIGTNYNIIVEPDRWQDEYGEWHYDDVSMTLGGTIKQEHTPNLLTFYKLKDLVIDDWVLGRNDTTGEPSVINFVDIENLTITYRLKPQNAATVRILNCNVTSDRHFSVPGSTLIIENSYVKLNGGYQHGALSTENNYGGSGTVIVRNSVFELSDTDATNIYVNLKLNSEFTISGTCTINGIFKNHQSGKDTDTYISFRDAILDENTNIQAGDEVGAALRFEGYNVLNGSTVEQNGDRDMTIESGSTLDMSGGASITVGGGVDVSNCGNISLDNATISAGSFTNEGSLTLSDGAEISLVHEHIETGDGTPNMVLEFDDFYVGKTVTVTVTDKNGNVIALTSDTVTPAIDPVDGKCKATITRASGTFSSTGKYTVAHDGYFVNAENGTLTAQLQSDGSLGITTSDGTPVPIENTGTIYIDLSHADLPEATGDDLFINLQNLNGDGDVVVIGGGGEYQAVVPGEGGHPARIKLNTPPTTTLYVNQEWSNAAVYKKGTNVGSFTYFGYNAYKDNPGADESAFNLTFPDKKDTSKVIYYGGNEYTGLNLATAEKAPNQLTLTTLGSMSTATLKVTFTVGSGDARTVSIIVKDAKGKIVEKQNYAVEASGTSTTYNNVVFYSSSLSQSVFEASGYTVSIIDNGVTTQLETGWTVADLSGDRDTATLTSLTTGAAQTVTLSGATMAMASVQNAGMLKVGTGESAILEIPVAPSKSIRDVKVVVKIGSNEEYHTVQATADASSVTVESKSFAPGQEYTVSLTDTKQYSAVNNTLSVDVVSGKARTINVVVRNAEGMKFTFTNVSVAANATKVTLDPHDALDNTSATVSGSPEGISVTNEGGSLTLHVNGTVDAQKVDVYVQKTVGDTVYRFDYTFNVAAHTGDTEKIYTVSTRLSSDGYYYVEAAEPEITATAKVNGISGAQAKAGDVTNNGTLVVASQEDVGKLNLTVASGPEDRTVQVKVMDGEFTVGIYDADVGEGSTSAYIVSSDLLAGKTYTATVTDTRFQTVNPSVESGTAPKLTFALADITFDTYTVQVTDRDSGDIIGNYTARKITSGDDIGKYTVVSGEFVTGTNYTVSAMTAGDTPAAITVTPTPVAAVAGGEAAKLAVTVAADVARTVTAVVKNSSGNIVGTFGIAVAEDQTEISLVSSEFTGTGYTVSMAGENTYAGTISDGIPAVAASSRKSAKLVLDVDKNDNASRWIEVVTGGHTYSLFVEKGASKAELESEDFSVGTEYSDVNIKDAYSAAITAAAGEDTTKTLTLTGLSSSDNVIRPDGPILRTLKATVRDGATVVDTYTITDIDTEGNAVISDTRLTAGKEYTVEVSDKKTVVATAETLSVFDSTGTITNNAEKTITVTDATFKAGTLTNSGTITLSNALLTVGTTIGDGFAGGTITNGGSILMDVNSLITAGSITNNGTITINAMSFDTDTTDMKKVIDLDNNSGTLNLILNATDAAIAGGIGILYDSAEHDYWVVAANQSTVYVNEDWATDEYGLPHKTGDSVGDKLYYGYNAFGSFTEAYAETLKVNPYTLNGTQQTITTIEVYGPTAAESAKDALLFFGDNGKVVSDLTITVHAPGSTADAVIPFLNDDYGINISPANGVTITIDSGITIRTEVSAPLETNNDQCSGTVYLNHQRTSGTIKLDGKIDSAREIIIYGKTDVSNTGSLNAASLLWINSGSAPTIETRTVTATGTGGDWTAAPQISAENILFSSGKLEITDSKFASKGLVFGYSEGVNAENVLLESVNTDWTLNNIATQTKEGSTSVSSQGTYQFTDGSILVKGDIANTINNAGTAKPGEVAIGSGVTLELANNPLTVQKGEYDSSTGAILNSGTIKTDLSSLITAESINNTDGTITIAVDDFNGVTNGMKKVIALNADDAYDLITSTVNFTSGGLAVSGYYLAYEHSAYDYWVTDAPQTTLYVNEDWITNPSTSMAYSYGDYIETVDEINRYYGYNAFNSFTEAITMAATACSTVVNVVSGTYNQDSVTATTALFPTDNFTISGEAVTLEAVAPKTDLILRSNGNTFSIANDITFTNGGNIVLNWLGDIANATSAAIVNGDLTAKIKEGDTTKAGGEIQIDGNATVNGKLSADTLLWLRNGRSVDKALNTNAIVLNNDIAGETVLISSGKITTAEDKKVDGTSLVIGPVSDDTGVAVNIISSGSDWTFASNMLATGNKNDAFTLNGGSIAFNGEMSSIKIGERTVDDDLVLIENANFTLNLNGGATMTAQNISDAGTIIVNGATLKVKETLTISAGGSLSVKGTSTLKGQDDSAMTLDGTATLKTGAALTASNITGGAIAAEGTVSVTSSTISSNSFTATTGATVTFTDNTLNDTTITATATDAAVTFTGSNTLNSATLAATNKTITNSGTLSVDALSTITASAISGGVLNITTAGLALGETTYHIVNAALQNGVSIQLNSSTTDTSVTIGTKIYNLTTFADKGVYLTQETQDILYVYGSEEDARANHLYGYNSFSSFTEALKVAANLTPADKTTIRVMSDISENYAFDDAALPLKGNILIDADAARTIALTQTKEGSYDSYRADLCPKPANGKTLIFSQNITFRTVDGGTKKHDGLWLNYGGKGTTQVSGHIISGTFIGFGGQAITVNETGTIDSGKDIQFLSSGTYAIDGNGQYTEMIDGKLVARKVDNVKQYQLNGALGLAFVYGTITVDNTAVCTGTLSFGDGWARNPYNPALTMISTNSVWDVNEIVLRYFTSADLINTDGNSYGRFNFVNSTVTVAQNIVNEPHKAEDDGTDGGKLENCNLAMTISLIGSTMNVGGNISNSGTINIMNSTLTAGTVANTGTFIVSAGLSDASSELHIGTLNGNAVELLEGATIKDSTVSTVTTGGSLHIGTHEEGEPAETVGNHVVFCGTNDFASAIDNDGFITVNDTLSTGAIDNDGEITVNGTLISGSINNDGEITVNGTLNATDIANGNGTITVNAGASVSATSINDGTIVLANLSTSSTAWQTFITTTGACNETAMQYKKAGADSPINVSFADGFYGDTDFVISKATVDGTTTVKVAASAGKTNLRVTTDSLPDGYLMGYNAFTNLADALDHVDATTETITIDASAAVGVASTDVMPAFAKSVTLTGSAAKITFSSDTANGADLVLTPAADTTLTIDANTTIETARGTVTAGHAGYIFFNYDRTSGIVQINGTAKAAGQITFYGAANVSKDGTIEAGELLWIAPGAGRTITVVGTGRASTSPETQVKAENIMVSTGKLDITDSVVEADGFVFGYNAGVAANDILLNSKNTNWTLSAIGTQILDDSLAPLPADKFAKGIYKFTGGTITVKGDKAMNLNNAGDIKPGEVVIGKGITLELSYASMTVQKGSNAASTGTMLNTGTITLDATSSLTAAGIDNTNGTANDSADDGTITVDARSTITATNGISGGTIDVITVVNSASILSGTSNTTYHVVQGALGNDVALKVDGVTMDRATIDGADIGNGYIITTFGGKGVWLTNQTQSVLYVDSTKYTDDLVGTFVNGHLVGYNAFSTLDKAMLAATDATATITIESDSTNATDVGNIYTAFGNAAITINGDKTATVSFATGNDLCLTPKDGGSLTIAAGTTVSTVGDKSSAYIVLNYDLTTGTVTVNGTIESSTEIALWGKTTVGTAGRLVSNDDGIILFRSGKAAAANSADTTGYAVTIGELGAAEKPEINATWFDLASGVVNVYNATVTAAKFLYSQNMGGNGQYDPSEAEFAVTENESTICKAVLNSEDTIWTIGDFEADGTGDRTDGTKNYITQNGEFNFTGDTISVSGVAKLGDKVTMNLTDSDMMVGGVLTNAGTIAMDLSSPITAAGIDNTNGTITVDATKYGETSGMKRIISLTTDDEGALAESEVNFTFNGETSTTYFLAYKNTDTGCEYWVTSVGQATVYVDYAWQDTTADFGTEVKTGEYYEYNAFADTVQGEGKDAKPIPLTTQTSAIEIKQIEQTAQSEQRYGDLNLSAASDTIAVSADGAVGLGSLTTGAGQDVTLTSAEDKTGSFTVSALTNNGTTNVQKNTSSKGKVTNNGTLTITDSTFTVTEPALTETPKGLANESNASITITNSTLDATGQTVTNSENASITVTSSSFTAGAVTNDDSSSFTVEGKTTLNIGQIEDDVQVGGLSGTITLNDGVTVSTSSVAGAAGDVTKALSAAGALNFSGTNTLTDVTLTANSGTLTNESAAFVTLTNSAVIAANQSIMNSADATISVTNSTFTAGSFTNNAKTEEEGSVAGSITIKDSTFIAGTVTNNGTIHVGTPPPAPLMSTMSSPKGGASSLLKAKSLRKGGASTPANVFAATELITDNGTFTVSGTSKLDIGTLTGTVDLLDGAIITDSRITSGGTLSVAEGRDATFSGTNAMATTAIDNSGSVTINGTMNSGVIDNKVSGASVSLSSATLNTSSNLTNVSGAGISLTSSTINASSATINNSGTITMNALSQITANSIDNGDSGTITISADGLDSTFKGFRKAIDITSNTTGALIISGAGKNVNLVGNDAEGAPEGLRLFQLDGSDDVYIGNDDNSTIYVGTAYTTTGDVVNDHLVGYNATSTITGAINLNPSNKIIVQNGTYSDITQLNGIKTTIQKTGSTNTVFTKAVYGGIKTTTAAEDKNNPVNRSIDLTVTGGSFSKLIVGGDNVNMINTTDEYYVTGATQTFSISGGLFKSGVAAGDRFEEGELHRTGNICMNISGGTFTYCVAGGMMNVAAELDVGHAFIDGNVETTITGGTFTDTAWLYGGGVSTGKKTTSALSQINGSVTITVNADGVANNGIVLSHIAAGSHGYGKITGSTKLVFIGDGIHDDDAVKFTANGELWGSSTGDSINPITGKLIGEQPIVTGERILSFIGFNGNLGCSKIRAFSKIEIKNRMKTVNDTPTTIYSAVTLDNENFNLSGVDTWEFDCGSTLSGNFANDFSGDTLNLVGFSEITAQQILMTDTLNSDDRDVFQGFVRDNTLELPGLSAIRMDGTDVSGMSFADNAYTFNTMSGSYKLSLETSGASTSMVLAKLS